MEKPIIGKIRDWDIIQTENPGKNSSFSYEVHGYIDYIDYDDCNYKKPFTKVTIKTGKIIKLDYNVIETQSSKYELDNLDVDAIHFDAISAYLKRIMAKDGVIVI